MYLKEKHIKKTPLFKLTNRLVLFLLALIFLVFIFYISGNWQNFLDKNQLLLLASVSIISVILLFFSLFGLSLVIHNMFLKKRFEYGRYLLLYVLYIAIGIVMFLFSTLLNYFSK